MRITEPMMITTMVGGIFEIMILLLLMILVLKMTKKYKKFGKGPTPFSGNARKKMFLDALASLAFKLSLSK